MQRMSLDLNSVHPSSGLRTPSKAAKAGAAECAGASSNVVDTVRLSQQGRQLFRLSEFMSPTPENVQKLSTALAEDLKTLFRQSTIDSRSGIGIEVDSQSGEIGIKGNPADTPQIAAMIGLQPDIARQIQDIATLSRQVVESEQGASAHQREQVVQAEVQVRSIVADYASRLSDQDETHPFSPIPDRHAEANPQASRAVAQYAAISGMSGEASNVSMVFNGIQLQIYANGRPWASSGA
jgi:hypothetical protein